MRHRILTFLTLLPFVLATPAAAERRDHERARAAMEAGQIRPLSEILAEVERQFQGRVIEAELELSEGRWLYEIMILPPSGKVFTVEMNATTGALIHSDRRRPSI